MAEKKTQNIFQRYELKYMLTDVQKDRLIKAWTEHMEKDVYFRSTICNIYYDTPTCLLIRHSLDKPVYKEKLRLRSYGVPGEDSTVFLELKKKYKQVVYKRRVTVPEKAAVNYLEHGGALPADNQIGREIDYFLNFYQDIVPSAFISYERESYAGIEDPSFRVTFDKKITWRTEDLSLTSGIYGRQLLSPGHYLMEVKAGDALPLWMAHLINKLGICQTSFSKYGAVYQTVCREKDIISMQDHTTGKEKRKYA